MSAQNHRAHVEDVCRCAAGIRAIAGQEEPIGRQISKMEIAEGLVLEKARCRGSLEFEQNFTEPCCSVCVSRTASE